MMRRGKVFQASELSVNVGKLIADERAKLLGKLSRQQSIKPLVKSFQNTTLDSSDFTRH